MQAEPSAAPAFLDVLAGELFAALNAAGPSDESDDDAPQDAPRPELAWRPDVDLGSKTVPSGQPSSSRRGDLAKQLHVQPGDGRRRGVRAAKEETAGRKWFDLPATTITDEVKRDLRTLALRTAFDPKTFYKKPDKTKFPKYFQFGTVVEGAADFFSARMPKSERRATLTEQVLADPQIHAVRKKRYTKLQEAAGQGRKKAPTRKTKNPRLSKKPKKPKH